jgi:hypothetical protein
LRKSPKGRAAKRALTFSGKRIEANAVMTKATGKTRKTKSKSGAARGGKKPPDFEAVRKRINDLVGNQAVSLVQSAIDEADKGHFTAMKYLFEMIGLYPETGEEAMPGEESLARTLLQRLGVPDEMAGETAEANVHPVAGAVSAGNAVE